MLGIWRVLGHTVVGFELTVGIEGGTRWEILELMYHSMDRTHRVKTDRNKAKMMANIEK